MGEKEMVIIENSDGSKTEVELVTYLVSDDNTSKYIVYSKGEKSGEADDEIIYIAKIVSEEGALKLNEITDDNEWLVVQNLLKKIANA